MVGADYSWARPGGAALVKAGITSVGRYLASDGRGITRPEFDDLVGHGVSVWFIKEGGSQGMLGGRPQGVADAQQAVQQMAAVGVSGAVIYATADFDVADTQFGACDAYLAGFQSVIGLPRVGIYAGLHYLNHAAKLATYFWQAGATSWNHRATAKVTIHLEQTTDVPAVSGTDVDILHQLDHGQVTRAGVATVGPVTPIIERKHTMSTLYYTKDAAGNLFALAGDGAGAAAWLETRDNAFANELAKIHGADGLAVFLTPASYAAWKALYLTPAPAVGIDYDKLAAAIVKAIPAATQAAFPSKFTGTLS
jgi:Domain of unknown function (DUF1906).